MNECSISVVIPTFNRAALLPDALDSVFAQSIEDVQVIVVDDGSTDETRALVAARYAGRVEYIFQENCGASAARNRGCESARGEFISFLDSDDVWLGGKARAELSVFARLPDVEAIISDSEYWTENQLVFPSRFAERGVRFDDTDDDGNNGASLKMLSPGTLFPLRGSVYSTCCLTLRRGAFERLGGFDVSFPLYEDWDFEIRLFHACRVVALPQVTAQVRRFADRTRRGRPLPGTPPDARQAHFMLTNQSRVLEKTLTLASLPPHAVAQVAARMREVEQEMDGLSLAERSTTEARPSV